jgi:ABC-type lipoprotein export system ATPase subunit
VLPLLLQENAKLHYGNPADFTLTVPEFSIKPGEVVAIVGRVGCGELSWCTSLGALQSRTHKAVPYLGRRGPFMEVPALDGDAD